MNDAPFSGSALRLGPLRLLRYLTPSIVAVGLLYLLGYVFGIEFSQGYPVLAVLTALLAPGMVSRGDTDGIHRVHPGRVPLLVSVCARWAVVVALLLGLGYALKESEQFSRRVMLIWIVLTPLLTTLMLLLLERVQKAMLADGRYARKAVFAGFNEVSRTLAERLKQQRSHGMVPVGFFDDRSADRLQMFGDETLLGGLPELPEYVKRERIDVIFVVLPMRHVQRVMQLLEDLRDTTASIYYVPDVFVFDLIQARTGQIEGMPVVAMCETPYVGYRGTIKRAIDLGVGLAALALAAPVMLLAALAVKASSPGPVIFRQRRYGLDGREIWVYKFRTMCVVEDGAAIRQATRNDARITAVGRFLRRSSIDELPQLFNVISGEMSLVGPRPHAVAHNEEYRRLIKGYMLRHKVKPGITGLAQINGCRGETARIEDMEARISYDLEYLRHWSPLLDFKIILLTAVRAVGDERAY